MPALKISIEKAKQDKLFYFVANVVVYRKSDGRCLILKRSEREIAHPGRYGVIGGKLEWADTPLDGKDATPNGNVIDFNDSVEKLLIRESMEEAGITIAPHLEYINSKTFIRPDEVPVVLVKFAAIYESGDVVVEEGSFSDHAWVNEEEVKNYECIDGIAEEVEKTIKLFRNKGLF